MPGYIAELDAEGKVLLGTGSAGVPNASELWAGLVAGQLSVLETGDGMTKRYLFIENDPSVRSLRALTKLEVDVLAQASRGTPMKLVAYALDVSSSSVSLRLASAAAKVGATSRTELLRLAALLTKTSAGFVPSSALTEAERSILELVQRGLSNHAIAKVRARSIRTIANQVSSLLRKTRAPSRRALLVSQRALR